MVCESEIVYGIKVWGLMEHGKKLIRSIVFFLKNNRYTKLHSKWICGNGTWQGE
jgi:hypothetical protein